MAAACGLDHRLVRGCVLVGPEENLVQLRAHRRRAHAGRQLGRPGLDLGLYLLLFLDRRQRLRQDLGRRLFVAAFAGAAEIVRGALQTEQGSDLLGGGGVVAEILARQVGKSEFVFGRELVGQLQLQRIGQRTGSRHQLGWGRFVKTQQGVGRFHLHAFARIQLHLKRALGFGQEATGQQFPGIVKQNVHGRDCPMHAVSA